ncbi:MAG: hypothetical protein ACYC3I_09875 [Gemmataceae bacterium]
MRVLVSMVFCLLAACPVLADYEWRTFADDKDQLSLWQEGRQVGNWRISSREYFPLVANGVWGKPCPPPYPPPQDVVAPGKVESDGTINFGLDQARLRAGGKHLLGGKEVSKEELLQAIGRPQLPKDDKWLSLTIIGPEAARKMVLSDLLNSPFLMPWKDRIKVRDYPPDHWAVKDAGFVTTGQPTIYCQAADGTVLHRQDAYRGPEALAEVLRRADPNYQPERDPDLNKPLSSVPPWLWIGGGILLVFLWKGDEK